MNTLKSMMPVFYPRFDELGCGVKCVRHTHFASNLGSLGLLGAKWVPSEAEGLQLWALVVC